VLSSDVVKRILDENQILGLKFALGTAPTVAYFEIKTKERPINLKGYALGSTDGGVTGTLAVALTTTGTGWDEIVDAAGRYLLEPEYENLVFHCFYGISPAYAWVYRRYPANVDRGSLIGTREVGGKVGAISGYDSKYNNPSPETEFFTVKGTHPSFLGYHPYTNPAATYVYLNVFVVRYGVEYLGYPGHPKKQPTEEQMAKAMVRTMGGEPLVPMPEWLRR